MSSHARAADGALRPGSPLRDLRGVGPVRARQLAEAGYRTVGELLGHLPHRYEDRSTVRTVAQAVAAWRAGEGARLTLSGRLVGVRAVRVRRRGFSLVRGKIRDETGELPVVWFNRPYLARQVDPETEYLLHGELRAPRGAKGDPREADPELLNPSVEPVDRALHAGRVVPVYPAAGEIGPAAMRRLIYGELLGTRQAGALGFRVADPVADAEWLERARADAAAIVDRLGDPGFERLARRVARRLRRRA